MKTDALGKLLMELARPLGYRRRSGLFWKPGPELTPLIHLQRSRWGGGMYVNFGLIPTALITKPAPPGPAYWPLSERGESFESPFREQFRMLAMDHEDELPPEEMREALRWLLSWIESHLADPAAFRAALSDPQSWLSRRGSTDDGALADWARGELKSASHYFSN